MRGSSFEVIVVDNASTKGEIEKELKSFPGILLIKSTENIGFGRANNLGFEKSKGDFIFLLNSDAYLVDDSSVPMMLKYLNENEDVGIVGPNFIKADGSKNFAYGNLLGFRKMISDMGFLKIPKEKQDDYATFKVCDTSQPQKVGYLAAAGVIIKRSVINKIGLFDPNIFLYYEDMELGWRYSQSNYSSYIIPQATIVHLGGGSISNISKQLEQRIIESKDYYLYKSLNIIQYAFIYILGFSIRVFTTFKKNIKLKQ